MFKNKFVIKNIAFAIFGVPLGAYIFLIASALAIYLNYANTIDRISEERILNNAKVADAWVQKYKHFLTDIASHKDLVAAIDNEARLIFLLKFFKVEDIPDVVNLSVINAEGKRYSMDLKARELSIKYAPNLNSYKEIILQGKDTYISNIQQTDLFDKPIFIMAKAIKNRSGKTIALVSFGLDTRVFQKEYQHFKVQNSMHNWAVDGKGNIFFHDAFNSGVNALTTKDKNALTESVKLAIENKGTTNSLEFKLNGKNYISMFKNSEIVNDWIFGSTFLEEDLYSPASSATRMFSITTFIEITITLVLCIYFVFKLYSPIITINQAIKNIASSEADLTKRVKIRNKGDEFAKLVFNGNTFLEKLQDEIGNILSEAKLVAENVKTVATATKEIFDQSERANSGIFNISSAMREMVATSEDISINTESAASHVRKTTDDSTLSLNAIEDVIITIDNQAKSIFLATQDIHILQEDGKKITAILEVINGIAEQTNLLALNAAIEAARAGEHGKGFAVVADEVRSLAQKTHESTKEIQNTINSLNANIDKVAQAMISSNEQAKISVNSAKMTEEVIRKIDTSMDEVASMNLQIASATQQQTNTANELSQVLETIADFSQKTQEQLELVVDSTNQLENSYSELKTIMSKFIIG